MYCDCFVTLFLIVLFLHFFTICTLLADFLDFASLCCSMLICFLLWCLNSCLRLSFAGGYVCAV